MLKEQKNPTNLKFNPVKSLKMKEKQRNFKQRKTEVMCHQQTHYNGIIEENFLRQKENFPRLKYGDVRRKKEQWKE